MKHKLILGLALSAAMLVVAQPSYGFKRGGGGGARASVHAAASHMAAFHSRFFAGRGGNFGGGNFAAHNSVNRSFNRNFAASNNSFARNNALAGRQNFAGTQSRNFASRNFTRGGNHQSVAFGGSGNNRNSHGTFAFASHSGWTHNREYFWSGHHYRWYNNAWFIVDPYPYGYGYYGPDYGYNYDSDSGSAPVGVQVQAALQQQGYYDGPVDGIVGPGTANAIANYQRDNGLRVTGTITNGLLYNLGIG